MKRKKNTLNNVYHKNIWRTGAVQIHVEPPPTPSIKIKNDTKAEKNRVKIKWNRYPTPENLDM